VKGAQGSLQEVHTEWVKTEIPIETFQGGANLRLDDMESSQVGGSAIRALVVGLAILLGVGLAHADTITDNTLDVQYTLTSDFVNEGGDTYDVTLVVSTTSFMGSRGATSGFLQAVALQFKTGSHTPTSVTLDQAPGGVADWSAVGTPGGTDSTGCNGKGASSGDVCFANLSANTAGAVPGTLKFIFDVTMPGTDALTAASDIKAVYNITSSGSGTFLGQTSKAITIQTGPQEVVPEPSSLTLLGSGMLVLIVVSRRRLVKC
jgi:hypothetical protein